MSEASVVLYVQFVPVIRYSMVGKLLGVGLLALTLSACQPPAPASTSHPASDVFGASYDECILRNATRGGDAESRESASEICTRHFSRQATNEELTDTVSGTIRTVNGPPQVIIIEAQNDSDNLIVTSIGVTVFFHAQPHDEHFHWADRPNPRFWTFPVHLAPHERISRVGTLPDGDAPGLFADDFRSVFPDKVIPIDGP